MIAVVWSNDVAAVVIKPAGIPTQAPAPHDSLETMVREQFSAKAPYIAFPHRLDRTVSGLILVAFTKRAARLLSEQFEARRVRKTYLALVQGRCQVDSATWIDQLRKVENEARVEVIHDDQLAAKTDVKLAELQMQVVERYQGRSLLELRPSSGRMHQIRVQCASRGHAIIGDTLYGSEQSCAGLLDGAIALQASQLEFNDPISGRKVTVGAPPAAWQQALH